MTLRPTEVLAQNDRQLYQEFTRLIVCRRDVRDARELSLREETHLLAQIAVDCGAHLFPSCPLDKLDSDAQRQVICSWLAAEDERREFDVVVDVRFWTSRLQIRTDGFIRAAVNVPESNASCELLEVLFEAFAFRLDHHRCLQSVELDIRHLVVDIELFSRHLYEAIRYRVSGQVPRHTHVRQAITQVSERVVGKRIYQVQGEQKVSGVSLGEIRNVAEHV
jgi:hypothetical protein